MTQKISSIRWIYLTVGVLSLLFAGIIYAWSILKVPFSEEFGWSVSSLTLNFTLTMSFFSLGGILGGIMVRKCGTRVMLIIAAIFASMGFILASRLSGQSIVTLYLTYGLLSGLGIGIAYNIIISTISAWFTDKKGLCNGCLMMGFGMSALIIGNFANSLFNNPALGWRKTYLILGISLGVVLLIASFTIRFPSTKLQDVPKNSKLDCNKITYTFSPAEMIKRRSFWQAFICFFFLAAIGSFVISVAKDLSLHVGANKDLAAILVGVLSIFNGLGRIIYGILFDVLGRRKTMLIAGACAIIASGTMLISVAVSSLTLCILGLCITGLSYGSCPTLSSAFVSEFYGIKYFSSNFAIMNCNIMLASLLATAASLMFTLANTYIVPFLFLLILTIIGLFLNIRIRKP